MRKSELMALAFSDVHLHDWPLEGYPPHIRIQQATKAIRTIVHRAAKEEVDVWFCGDLFHNPKSLDTHTFIEACKLFSYLDKVYPDTKIIGISGNHDQCESQTNNHTSPTYLNGVEEIWKNFTHLWNDCTDSMGFLVHGIPYHNGNVGLKSQIKGALRRGKGQNNILLLHTDLPGAKESDGREVGTVENFKGLSKYLKQFKLVLSGHIHRPQKLGKNMYMLGATHHQKTSDEGCEMGYWEIYDNFTMKFVPLKLMEFKTIKEVPENDLSYYWIKESKEVDESSSEGIPVVDFSTTKKKISIAKKYLTNKGIKSKSKKNTLIKVIKASTK